MAAGARVVALARDGRHRFGKPVVGTLTLVEGLGVEGDAHAGVTVRHRSRVRRDPTAPNLRQVHLLAAELLDELVGAGFPVGPGVIGENVTTRGVDLLALSTGTLLALGPDAVVEVTGLRNPCVQLERHARGLQAAVLARGPDGALVRRAGVMAVVRRGGQVTVGDALAVTAPAGPHRPLQPV